MNIKRKIENLVHDIEVPIQRWSGKGMDTLSNLKNSCQETAHKLSSKSLGDVSGSVLSLSKMLPKDVKKKMLTPSWLTFAAVTVIGGLIIVSQIKKKQLSKLDYANDIDKNRERGLLDNDFSKKEWLL